MKLPPGCSSGSNNGGFCGYTDNPNNNQDATDEILSGSISPILDDVSNSSGESGEIFEEYMWMENEEEFDNQVMHDLEEEALMQQCEEDMEDDFCLQEDIWLTDSKDTQISAECAELLGISFTEPCISFQRQLTQMLPHAQVLQSKLNPNADEFHPQEPSP